MRRTIMALEAFYEESNEGEAVQDPAKTETVVPPSDAEPIPPVANDTPPANETELVPPVEEEEVSLESLVTVLGMAMEEMAEIGANLKEAERAIQTSDALDDLAHIAKSIETATPAQAAMIETIGDMAVAGTDVEPEAVVPSLEQYVGRSIALEAEGIKERAKKIWEAIVAFVERIWEKIRNFWRGLQTKFYFAQIDQLEKEVKALSANDLSGKFESTAALDHVATSDVIDTLRRVLANYPEQAKKRGEAILKGIESFDPKDPSASLDALRKQLFSIDEKVDQDMKAVADFPGGYVLTHTRVKLAEDAGTHEALERLRNAGWSFAKSGSAKGSLTDKIEVNDIKSGALENALEELRDAVKSVAHFSEQDFKSLDDLSQRIKKATEALVKRCAEQPREVEWFHSLANFYKAYATWVYQPCAPLGAYILKLVAAALTGLRQVLKQAEKAKKTDDKSGEAKK